ncbi:hypothetical protein AJ78_04998 [Emergomyces pasteurianus Ep9510]|uniref:Isochorismatase-like domain-containing protein n=1 Tax=Emergomyces pasteurianus Ep9510 TaxID=1447872 RepID=A0A1J9PFE5_9EURO|nr:hypothetical protein AJ78_04998 [Emergomyces pasteurianus Ep9510]
MKALILIDLQNEFLDPEKGRFTIPESSRIPLLENIRNLVPAFRSHGCNNIGELGETQTQSHNLVIWVRAEYSGSKSTTTSALDEFPDDNEGQVGGGDSLSTAPNTSTTTTMVPDNSHFLTGTHTGTIPCCSPGSQGAEFYPPITPLIDTSRDVVLTKTWFSAFKETGLADILRSRSVDEVYFAGLLSNVCILASVNDSIRHSATSWKTHVVGDCLGYLREKSHAAALAKLHTLTLSTKPHNNDQGAAVEMVSTPSITSTFFHPHPALYYVNGSIPSWRVQLALHHKEIPTNDIRMYVMRSPKPTRTPAFLAINPRGKTPVFVDNDPARTRTYESLAILLYVEEYYPSAAAAPAAATSMGCNRDADAGLKHSPSPLLPQREQCQKRAQILCLMQESENLHSTYDALDDAYWDAKTEHHADDNSTPTPTSARFERFATCERPKFIQAIHDELAFWETHVTTAHAAGKRFLAGTDDLSLADCAFYPILAYMVHRGFVFTERFQGLEQYYWDVTGLVCVKRARPEGWGDGSGRGKTNVFGGR